MAGYKSPIGPSMPIGSRSATRGFGSVFGNASIFVDLNPVADDLDRIFKGFSENVRNIALYNAINHVARKGLTRIRRDVARSSGARYGRVIKAIKLNPAHPHRLWAKYEASDTAMPLIDFASGRIAPGTKNPRAKPWGKSRRFSGAFVIRFKSGDTAIVKRVADRSGGRGSHSNGSGKIKVLWGPIVPREMIREGNPSTQYLHTVVPQELIPRVIHELGQAVARGRK